eukprot:TRINITY_DN9564_c0_g1_i2.p1 TRINITY_DN9564_c0_g1~~TRINITY_DN9564_c0_g1_i2.p1  ORF type:complete len:129 (+),score=29.59 TRINITY_DN9564_c0_g1_i2:79-465(+)
MAKVKNLFVSPKKGEWNEVSSVEVEIGGFKTDKNFGAKNRQLLVTDLEILTHYSKKPGFMNENIVLEGVNIQDLPPGRKFKIGDVVFEVVEARFCVGQSNETEGKRGVFVNVIENHGTIKVGDTVTVL